MRLRKKQVPYINYPHTHLESWAVGKVDALTNTRRRRDTAARCTHPSPSLHSPLATPRASSSLCLHHRREAWSDFLRLSSLILASAQNPSTQEKGHEERKNSHLIIKNSSHCTNPLNIHLGTSSDFQLELSNAL